MNHISERTFVLNLFSVLLRLRLIFIVAAFTLCIVGQSQLTVEEAKNRLSELNFNYRTTDEVYRQRIEREVSNQANTQLKGEFETTKEFQGRLAKADQLRKALAHKYEAEKENRKAHFLDLIRELEDAEFQEPAQITFGTYDADTESLPITVLVEGESHDKVLKLARDEAKELKENATGATAKAVFGVGVFGGKPVAYFFAANILFRERRYSTLPKVISATQAELNALYKDPFVMHIRKTFNDILRGATPNHMGAEDLANVDKDYFRSKFIVGLITPSALGGKNVLIFFRDRPDVVFCAWVYKLASPREYPQYEVRGLWPYETDPAKVRILRIVAKTYDPKSNAL